MPFNFCLNTACLPGCTGTEIGGGFLSGSMLQAQAPSTFSTPTVGCCPVILSEGGAAMSPHGDEKGALSPSCYLTCLCGEE